MDDQLGPVGHGHEPDVIAAVPDGVLIDGIYVVEEVVSQRCSVAAEELIPRRGSLSDPALPLLLRLPGSLQPRRCLLPIPFGEYRTETISRSIRILHLLNYRVQRIQRTRRRRRRLRVPRLLQHRVERMLRRVVASLRLRDGITHRPCHRVRTRRLHLRSTIEDGLLFRGMRPHLRDVQRCGGCFQIVDDLLRFLRTAVSEVAGLLVLAELITDVVDQATIAASLITRRLFRLLLLIVAVVGAAGRGLKLQHLLRNRISDRLRRRPTTAITLAEGGGVNEPVVGLRGGLDFHPRLACTTNAGLLHHCCGGVLCGCGRALPPTKPRRSNATGTGTPPPRQQRTSLTGQVRPRRSPLLAVAVAAVWTTIAAVAAPTTISACSGCAWPTVRACCAGGGALGLGLRERHRRL
ncbi:hypothetical protein DVB88_10840 [Tsukamurella pulmonis]|nr:hypothetical protein DVB88_10840 [Tsukamurella pulmonis]